VPHPKGASWKETGNICFVLPSPRCGKSPETYNYIEQENLLVIEKEIEAEMKAELYSYLLDNRFNKGMMYKSPCITSWNIIKWKNWYKRKASCGHFRDGESW